MNNKRGLSDVVTNVLIILLVIIAVGIIWFFVRPTIDRGTGQLQGVNECITLNFEAISCSEDTGLLCGGGVSGEVKCYDVRVRRSAGEALGLSKLRFVFELSNGETQIVDDSVILDELEEKVYNIDYEGAYNSAAVSVAGVLSTGQGEKVCAPVTRVVCS